MGWYVELHCSTPSCPHGNSEEGPQGNSTKVVAREARRIGWGQDRDGLWRCPPCLAGIQKPEWVGRETYLHQRIKETAR